MPSFVQLVRDRRRKRAKPSRASILARISVWFISGLSISLLALLFITGIFYLDLVSDLPSIEDIQAWFTPSRDSFPPPVQVFDRSGETVVTSLLHPSSADRRWFRIGSQISPSIPADLIDAVVASQDETFWGHSGFDTQKIIGGIIDALLGIDEGNIYRSIPQRLVYMTILPSEDFSEPLLARYIRSAILAQNLVDSFPKEQILEWYLNSVRFGNLTQGVDTAADVFFDKSPLELNLNESAALAALLNQPGLNPSNEYAQIKEQQGSILARMVNLGWITEEEFLSSLDEPLVFIELPPLHELGLADLSERELLNAIGSVMYQRLGLQIYSSIDYDLQNQLLCATKTHLSRLSGSRVSNEGCPSAALLPALRPGDLGVDHLVDDSATVAIDPKSGEIRAIYGDTTGQRHPGRMTYPLLYLTAFSQGYAPGNMILDLPLQVNPGEIASQDVPDGIGPIRMRNALVGSLPYAADRTLELIGPDSLHNLMGQLGIRSGSVTSSDGSALFENLVTASVLDLGYAYSAFANLGDMVGKATLSINQENRLSPILILKITDFDGGELYTPSSISQSVLSPPLAYLIVDILSDSSARWPILGRPNVFDLEYPVAVMTEGERDLIYGSWTIGFTPSMVLSTWMGNAEGNEIYRVNAENGAASLWRALTEFSSQSALAEGWLPPSGIVEIDVCDPSGQLPTEYCPLLTEELFIQGTEPFQYDTLYVPFKVNRESGRLATMTTPFDLIEERVFFIPPAEAVDWAERQGFEQPPSEYDASGSAEHKDAGASIDLPSMFSNISGRVRIRGVAEGDAFNFYRLSYGKGLNPTHWVLIGDDQYEPQDQGLLGIWETEVLDGLYTLQLLVVDGDGTLRSDYVHVTIDSHVPLVSLDSLPALISISADEPAELNLIAQAVDNLAVEVVEFLVMDEVVGVDENPPYVMKVSLSDAGVYEIYVRAYDLAGNVGASEVQVVRVVDD
jgi:membrane peptidoglycan carboxypeptidase